MIIIDFPEFDLKRFLNDFYEFKEDQPHSISMAVSSGHAFIFSVDKKVVTRDINHLLNETLRNVNNGFYELLKSGRGDIAVLSGLGVPEDIVIMKLIGDNIFFNTYFPEGPIDKSELHDEQSGLIQAVEEALKAIKKYKDICLTGAKFLVPDHIDWIMDEFFPQPKTDEEYISFIKNGWRYQENPETGSLERHSRDSSRKIILHHTKEVVFMKQIKEQEQLTSQDNESEEHVLISDYNRWHPLEQAWEEYKQKHNITEEDIKKAITDEERKDELLRKKQRKWWKFRV